MNEQDLIKKLDEYLERIRQSGKKESSDIAGEVKISHGEIKLTLDEIKRRLDTANGYTAKHEQRLNSLDVINAQTTLTQQQTVKTLEEATQTLKGLVKDRDKAEGSIATFKWLFGLNLTGLAGVLAKLFLIQ